jgi:hypothetical protein
MNFMKKKTSKIVVAILFAALIILGTFTYALAIDGTASETGNAGTSSSTSLQPETSENAQIPEDPAITEEPAVTETPAVTEDQSTTPDAVETEGANGKDAAKGDVDGDGRITIFDISMAAQIVNGAAKTDEEQKDAADINENGSVNSGDVKDITKLVVNDNENLQ